jgi:hypothetical protein
MKKIRYITLIIAIMIGVSGFAGVPQSGPLSNANVPQYGMIKYEVHVYPSLNFMMLRATFYVALINKQGDYKDHPQLYNPQQQVYVFSEPGPVSDNRGATLFTVTPDVVFSETTDMRYEKYVGGGIYTFKIFPDAKPQN